MQALNSNLLSHGEQMRTTRRTTSRGPAAAIPDGLIGHDGLSRAQALYRSGYYDRRRFEWGALGLPIFLVLTALFWAFGDPEISTKAGWAFCLMLSASLVCGLISRPQTSSPVPTSPS